MYKLVSEVGTRWSFSDGYQIYGNVVWLLDKEDMWKYALIDEDGNEIDINVTECLVEE